MSYLRDLRRAVNDPRSFWPINAFGSIGASSSLAQTLVTTWSSSGDGLGMVFETTPSIYVKDSGTPANNTNLKLASGLSDFSNYLTYTNPHEKIVRQADGTLKYNAQNWVYYSEVKTDWITDSTTTSDYVGAIPDPYTEAFTITETVNAGSFQVRQLFEVPVVGQTLLCEAVVKQQSDRDVYLRHQALNFNGVVIDLADGSLISQQSNVDSYSVTELTDSAGDTWYKIRYSGETTTAGTNHYINLYNGGQSYASAGDGSITVTGIRQWIGPAVDEYIKTEGSAVIFTLPIQYDASGVAEGLLVEPAATNLIVSNGPGDASGAATVVENVQTAPSGLTEAATAEFDGTDALSHSITISSSTTYSYSTYVKNISAGGIIEVQWRNISAANKVSVWFDLTNGTRGTVGSASGTVTYVDSGIEDVDGSGWYRVWVAASTSGTNITPFWFAVTADNSSTRDNSGVIAFWRDQVEAGTVPTSLIITTNGATVTRGADNISKATSAFELGTAFSVYAKYSIRAYANFPGVVHIGDGGTTNRAEAYTGNTGGVTYRASASGTAVNLGNMTGVNTPQKVAYRVQEDSFNGALNGTDGTADTSGSMPAGVTTLNVGANRQGTSPLNGLIHEILVVPEGWNDATLESITT